MTGAVDFCHEIRSAIKRDEFSLCYQPIVDLKSLKLQGFEALIRWGDRDPTDFISEAENLRCIGPITDWVIDRGIADSRALGNVSINVSALDLEDPTFKEKLHAALFKYGVDGSRITLEITERKIAGDGFPDQLRAIKCCGISLAIDDFGTGFSGLLALIDSKYFSRIKLDKAFLPAALTKNQKEKIEICHFVYRLSKAFRLDLVAEGVETEIQHFFLQRMGFPKGQGYYYGKPQSIDIGINRDPAIS